MEKLITTTGASHKSMQNKKILYLYFNNANCFTMTLHSYKGHLSLLMLRFFLIDLLYEFLYLLEVSHSR